jgi:hypothetical protein
MKIGRGTQSAVMTALILFSGCARPMTPPGGPPDRLAPVVEWTFPGADTVGVDSESEIRIRFSESMDRRSVERAIFVSPAFSREPKLKWRGRELEIEAPEPLREDRTYLVTIGSESADESRNRMRSSYSFAFATGMKLSQGEIRGSIRQEGSVQSYVWAYDLQEGTSPDPSIDPPDYVTQPGQDGRFHIPRIGIGRYRVFGFVDKNRDQLFTTNTDALAVPAGDLSVSSNEDLVDFGLLKPVLRDTLGPVFLSARTPDTRHILLRFDEPVSVPRILEVRSESGSLEVLGTHVDAKDSSQVWVLTRPQVAGELYSIHMAEVMDRNGNLLVRGESAEARGDGEPDRRAPEVVSMEPEHSGQFIAPNTSLALNFSEAMVSNIGDGFWLDSDTTGVPEGDLRWVSPNRLLFEPLHQWEEGETQILQVESGILTDASGNSLEDPVLFRFSVSSSQDLGKMIGTVGITTVPTVVRATQLVAPYRTYQVAVAVRDTMFTLDGLIPGQYRISGFLDMDGDGVWGMGSAFPFVPSEPLADFSDTLEVRARWVTEAERPFLIGTQFSDITEER